VNALASNTSLHQLMERYPFLLDFLAGYNKKFELLQNPIMRATVGRAATLGRVAEMGDIPLEDLVRDIAAEVRSRTGEVLHPGAGAQDPDSEGTIGGSAAPGSAGASGTAGALGPDGASHSPAAAGSEGAVGAPAGSPPGGATRMKELIKDLHDGLPPEEARQRFDALIKNVSPEQIGAMEEQLIREGMPVQEIQRMCDLHVAVMRGGLDQSAEVTAPPGHPIHTYMAANEVITDLANRLGDQSSRISGGASTAPEPGWAPSSGGGTGPLGHGEGAPDPGSSSSSRGGAGVSGDGGAAPAEPALRRDMSRVLEELSGVHNHYLRKENQLFPFLERHGITGPPKVMWGVHDEIRTQMKEARAAVEGAPAEEVSRKAAAFTRSVIEMVYKENKILFPLAAQTLSRREWVEARKGEDELGYAFVEPAAPFEAKEPKGGGISLPIVAVPAPSHAAAGPAASTDALLDLGTGRLTLEQVDMILRVLPVDLSFVDADGFVRYYSETAERLFPRTPGAIGRHVENCHPPKSVHMVKEILRAFAAGEREVAEFWIEMGGKFIHIRYYAVRSPKGAYLGCLEVSQDVTGIRALEGQRRLLEWN
jgi:uncharacterized protein